MKKASHTTKVAGRIGLVILLLAVTSIKGVAQPDTIHIAQLLKEGSDYVLRPGNEKTDLDSALFFFNQALTISRTIRSDKWTNSSLLWIGDTRTK